MLRTSTSTETVRVIAPQLARVVDALWALAENPADRRAKIQLALLDKAGAMQCPSCATRFGVDALRATRTAYAHRSALVCAGCRTAFVVEDQQIS